MDSRSQITKLNKVISESLPNNFGVPQGSVLVQLFFLFYINDVGSVLTSCKTHLFADDTLIYFYGSNFENVVQVVNSELDKLFYNFKINKLKVNENEREMRKEIFQMDK